MLEPPQAALAQRMRDAMAAAGSAAVYAALAVALDALLAAPPAAAHGLGHVPGEAQALTPGPLLLLCTLEVRPWLRSCRLVGVGLGLGMRPSVGHWRSVPDQGPE
jgi:hypothetical protein